MPLQEGAINEIIPFAPEAIEEAGDILSLEEYERHPMRLRGNFAGLALRELMNREARQATHMAAGLAQFIANRYAPGVKDDGDLDKVEQGLLEVINALIAEVMPKTPEKYDLCEFYHFRHPTLRTGFQPAQGGLLVNAATLYPEAWAYLQTVEGQKLCKTEAAWQAMTTATWATLADGTKVGWNGIGGAPFYVQDTANGTLRLPDLRGMYVEAAGFDGLGVGGTHGDGMRNITGVLVDVYGGYTSSSSGAFVQTNARDAGIQGGVMTYGSHDMAFDPARVVPAAAKNQPRAWGALACVYLGLPAS